MPTVFAVSFDEILPALRLPEQVKTALVARHGALGELLGAVEALESEPGDAQRLPRGVSVAAFSQRLFAAMNWANRIG
jgi:c-di-GMP-related signal transduction protein